MTIHLHGVYADLNITENTPDEVLVTAARVGCDDSLTVLIARFLPVISRRAMDSEHSFLEKDDLIQEGMIALLRAIRFYQADRNATFATFATACINNSIRSALKATRRFKHMPLNNYVSLSEERAEDHIAQQLCANYTSSPETLVIKKEEYALIKKTISSLLSGFEREILMLYLKGLTYEQIATELCVTTKSVDNALQRTKKKLGAVIL